MTFGGAVGGSYRVAMGEALGSCSQPIPRAGGSHRSARDLPFRIGAGERPCRSSVRLAI